MPNANHTYPGSFRVRWLSRRVSRYFFHGLILVAPIAITVLALRWIFNLIDGLLRPYVGVPGVGFVVILCLLVLAGWFSSFLLVGRLFERFDEWMTRTPGVTYIYSSVRDFFEAFVGRKRKFKNTVLVNVFADEVWLVGFQTDEELEKFKLGAKYVSVYVPQAYNIAGQLYLVQRERVRPVDTITPGDAMKYAVTGGAVQIAPTS